MSFKSSYAKKLITVFLPIIIWGITILYHVVAVPPLSNLMLSISEPSYLGLIIHTFIQLTIVCIPTAIAVKKLSLTIKSMLLSIAIMYFLFAVCSPPSLYFFVYTGGWSGFWQQSQPAMPGWKASLFITLQYGIVMLITKMTYYVKEPN
ncbi:MAG: hypothetical protein K2N56_04955 [Oscillospiraceae bacterium]|nr:hypothetical protein [Oscillospiraceae bacterium]